MEHPIKKLRKEKRLTQIQLAEALGVDQATVSKWESGKIAPSREYEDKLAGFFGVSVDLLLGLETREELAYTLYEAAGNLPREYAELLSEYSSGEDFRRMVKLWGSLSALQRRELLGYAQGMIGRAIEVD